MKTIPLTVTFALVSVAFAVHAASAHARHGEPHLATRASAQHGGELAAHFNVPLHGDVGGWAHGRLAAAHVYQEHNRLLA